ncbi:MAG: hydrogenase/urease maturation nickel metallochaperone HypA [Chloroflexota bacterium]
MHELSLVADLLDAATLRADGAAVTRLRVRHASSLPEDALRQAFQLVATGGPFADVALDTEPFAVGLTCPCGFDGALGHDDVISPTLVACPSCGDVHARSRTAELELLEVVTA